MAIGPVMFLLAIFGYQFVFELPRAREAQAHLVNEFDAITPLANAKIMEYDSSSKMSQALVAATYTSDSSQSEIFNYYDQQLVRNGWQLKSADELGGRAADYCKGSYNAELQYNPQKTKGGWTYGLGMSWGLHDCKAAFGSGEPGH
jgi:hypothetical protein